MYSPNHKVSSFGFGNIYDSVLILLHPHLYINSQDYVHLVQYNLLNMSILFQYMCCHNTNMTLTCLDLPQCTAWFGREPTHILK